MELEKIFVEGREFKSLVVTVLSFGFKYGIPADADLVFDVRFLPNPYYIDELKKQTGNDKPVQDYVMGFDVSHVFLNKLTDMVQFLLPNYVQEGKNQLIIGIEIAVMFPDPTSSAPIWLACITNGISVGIGELISCTVLGVLLVRIIEASPAVRKVFES